MLTFDISAHVGKLQKSIKQAIEKGAASAKPNVDMGGDGGSGGGGSLSDAVSGGIGKAAAIGSIIAFLANLKPISDSISVLTGLLGFAIFQVFIGLKKAFSKSVEFLKQAVAFLGNVGSSVWSYLKEGFMAVVDGLGDWIGKAIGFIAGLPSKIWGYLKQGFNFVVKGLQTAWKFITQVLSKGWELLKGAFKKVGNVVVGALRTAWQTLKSAFNAVKNALVNVFNTVKAVFQKGLTAVTKWLTQLGKRVINLRNKAVSAIQKVVTTVKDWLKQAVEALKQLPSAIWNAVKQGFDMIVNAVKNALGAVGGAVRDAISSISFGFSSDDEVNDAVITSDGKVIKTDPRDTLIATQNPGGMGGGSTFNFYGVTSDEMVEEVKRVLGRSAFEQDRF